MPAVAVGPHDGTSGSSVSTLGSDHASNGRCEAGETTAASASIWHCRSTMWPKCGV